MSEQTGEVGPVLWLSPEVQKRHWLETRAENAQARREERERAAAASAIRQEQETMLFMARMRGEVPPSNYAEAMTQMAVAEANEEITANRCHALVDRYLAGGGTVARLRSLLEDDLG